MTDALQFALIYHSMSAQIKCKERVAEFGEVNTGEREVNAMLDLVKQETDRIESRFLEPACGDGNFLIEILRRKLDVVEHRYRKSQLEWERNAILALTSIYGVDILEDNVEACRARLFAYFDQRYAALFKSQTRERCRNSALYILSRNILWGDALTLRTVEKKPGPIVFSEWSPVNGSQLKRRDFEFHELVPKQQAKGANLFESAEQHLIGDTGGAVFIPEPVNEFPLTHFLEVGSLDY